MSKTTVNRIFIHPYKQASSSAASLAEAVGGKRLLVNGKSKYKHRESDLVINWGSSKKFVDCPMLNEPTVVSRASNKLTFFEALKNSTARLVPYTSDVKKVVEWLDKGHTVCARTKLTGHSAEGLVVLDPKKELDIPDAKLYTKYVPKSSEYRVHVFNGEAIRIQKKILRPELTEQIRTNEIDSESIDWKVRNHKNGFIYVVEGVREECPEDVVVQALQAVKDIRLVFGAVDVIWNRTKKNAFVLEINTSPGLEGGTIDAYVEAIKGLDIDKIVKTLGANPYSAMTLDQARRCSSPSCWSVRSVVRAARGISSEFCSWSTSSQVTGEIGERICATEFESFANSGEVIEDVILFAQAICDKLEYPY